MSTETCLSEDEDDGGGEDDGDGVAAQTHSEAPTVTADSVQTARGNGSQISLQQPVKSKDCWVNI